MRRSCRRSSGLSARDFNLLKVMRRTQWSVRTCRPRMWCGPNFGDCKRNFSEFQFWSLCRVQGPTGTEKRRSCRRSSGLSAQNFNFQGHEAYSVGTNLPTSNVVGVSPNFGDCKRNFPEFQFWSLCRVQDQTELRNSEFHSDHALRETKNSEQMRLETLSMTCKTQKSRGDSV